MTGQAFAAALAAALSSLGRAADEVADGPEALEPVLRGQGLAARSIRLAPDELPDTDMAAALVELEDGTWLPVLPSEFGVKTLDGLSPTGLAHAGRAILLLPQTDMVRDLLPFLRRHKARLLELIGAGLLVNLLALVFPLFGSFVYDKVLGNGIIETLWALAIGAVLAIALDFSIRAVRTLLVERFAVTSEADIDRALFARLTAGNLARLPAVGLVLDKYKQILGGRDFLTSAYMLSALDLPFLLLFLLAIAHVAGPLVFVPLVVGSAVVAVHMLLAIPAHDYEGQARRAGERRFALLADSLAAREILVGSRLRDELARRWRRTADRAGVAAGRARYWHTLAHAVSYGASNFAYVATIVGGAYMIEDRALTTGGLLAATMLTARALSGIGSVVLLMTRYREFRQSLAELDALIPEPSAAKEQPKRGPLIGHLHLSGVGCRLRQDGRPTLQDLELKAEPGEIIGIAGHPGAGKTTLLRLIAGVLPPDEGQVLIDGFPLADLSPDDLSELIGFKPQEPCLLDGTIEDNLRASHPGASVGQITEALAASGLALSIERGELTLATPVGPGGSALSGGQRQMLALARALLCEPRILLLDEPNNGLDAPLEKMLAERLLALQPGRIILLSSHSRALLSICTRIVVLDGGRIITDGPRTKVLGA